MSRSSVVIDELCPAWTPLPTRRKRRPTFPSRGRLLETAPLKLMTLASGVAVAADRRLYILCPFLYSLGEHPIWRWYAAEKCSMEE